MNPCINPSFPMTSVSIRPSKPRINIPLSTKAYHHNSNARLLSALSQQITTDTLPWLSDLVLPLFSDDTGSSNPPPPTVDSTLLADPDSQFMTIDNIRLHYKSTTWNNNSSNSSSSSSNNDDTVAVLLCHGFNGSTFSWRYTLDAFSASTTNSNTTTIRLIAFDRPPFGLSDRPTTTTSNNKYNPYSLEGNIKLTVGLLKQLGITKVIAVGHSAGAITAMELYNHSLSRQQQKEEKELEVLGLCLVAPALPTNNPEASFMKPNTTTKQGGRGGGGLTLGAQLRFLITRGLLSNDVTGLRYVRRQLLKRRDEVMRGDFGAFTQGNTAATNSDTTIINNRDNINEAAEGYLKPLKAKNWDKGALLNLRAFQTPTPYNYSATKVPVMIVNGDNDGRLTVNGRALAEEFSQRTRSSSNNEQQEEREGLLKTEYLELQAGHLPMEEKPEEFNQALADFILHCCSVSSSSSSS